MKVEFKNGEMIITGREFRKAHDDPKMMKDLMWVTECFTAPYWFEYCLSKKEYENYYPLISDNSKIIFQIKENQDYWVEILMKNNNKIQKLRWSEDGGESIWTLSKK